MAGSANPQAPAARSAAPVPGTEKTEARHRKVAGLVSIEADVAGAQRGPPSQNGPTTSAAGWMIPPPAPPKRITTTPSTRINRTRA